MVLRFGCCGSFLFCGRMLEFTVFAISFRLGVLVAGLVRWVLFGLVVRVGLRRFLVFRFGVGLV